MMVVALHRGVFLVLYINLAEYRKVGQQQLSSARDRLRNRIPSRFLPIYLPGRRNRENKTEGGRKKLVNVDGCRMKIGENRRKSFRKRSRLVMFGEDRILG